MWTTPFAYCRSLLSPPPSHCGQDTTARKARTLSHNSLTHKSQHHQYPQIKSKQASSYSFHSIPLRPTKYQAIHSHPILSYPPTNKYIYVIYPLPITENEKDFYAPTMRKPNQTKLFLCFLSPVCESKLGACRILHFSNFWGKERGHKDQKCCLFLRQVLEMC
jgi:hypothetical protein